MELCQPVRSITLDVDLKLNMLRMHQLKVVHSDIKPPNVMFSPSYQKNVFLDFGVAEVINEEIW
jgi:serine/threonine protein kinase